MEIMNLIIALPSVLTERKACTTATGWVIASGYLTKGWTRRNSEPTACNAYSDSCCDCQFAFAGALEGACTIRR